MRVIKFLFVMVALFSLLMGAAAYLVTTPMERVLHTGVWQDAFAYAVCGGFFLVIGLMIKPKKRKAASADEINRTMGN